MLKEWAYAVPYPHSRHRTAVLELWLEYYNRLRPNSCVGVNPNRKAGTRRDFQAGRWEESV